MEKQGECDERGVNSDERGKNGYERGKAGYERGCQLGSGKCYLGLFVEMGIALRFCNFAGFNLCVDLLGSSDFDSS